MRILIADGRAEVRSALRLLLEQELEGADLIGDVAKADDLLPTISETNPDLLLLGWNLPGLGSPLAVLDMIRACCTNISIITLSGQQDVKQQAVGAGADASINKGDCPQQVLSTIRRVREENRL